ncbi:MAG: hypothetical protein ACP5TO_07510 [Thermoplasmata archaeon]
MKNSNKKFIKIFSIFIIVVLIIISFQFLTNLNTSNYSKIDFKGAYLDYQGNYILNAVHSFSSIPYINGTVLHNFTCLKKINDTSMLWSGNSTVTTYIPKSNNSLCPPFSKRWNFSVTNRNYSNQLPVFNNTLIQIIKDNQTLQTRYPIFTVNTLSFMGDFVFPIIGKKFGFGINYYKYILNSQNNSIKVILINYSLNSQTSISSNYTEFIFYNLTFWINENTGIILKVIFVYAGIMVYYSDLINITNNLPLFFNLTYLENLIKQPSNFYGEIQTINLISTNIKMNSTGPIWFFSMESLILRTQN